MINFFKNDNFSKIEFLVKNCKIKNLQKTIKFEKNSYSEYCSAREQDQKSDRRDERRRSAERPTDRPTERPNRIRFLIKRTLNG